MRMLISLLVIVYLVGVGVFLAPTFQSGWGSDTTPQLLARLAKEMPSVLAWPVTAYRKLIASS